MKLHRTKNLFTPIIELRGEYYLVDFVPKWWQMFFGFWRCALFSSSAKKINKEDLPNYVKKLGSNKRNRVSTTIGLGSSAFAMSLIRAMKKSSFAFAPFTYFLFLIVEHITFLTLFYLYLKKRGYKRITDADYKLKYKVNFKPIGKFIKYLTITLLFFWVQWGHIPTLFTWVNESYYPLSSIYGGVVSVLFWWCNIFYFTLPDYGVLIAYNNK